MRRDVYDEETRSTSLVEEPDVSNKSPWPLHFVLIWAKHEPERVGEGFRADRLQSFGRESSRSLDEPPRVEFFRFRVERPEPRGPLRSSSLSRRQWTIQGGPASIQIDSIGRRALLHNGRRVDSAKVVEGDVVGVDGVVSFLLERRPTVAPSAGVPLHEFGLPDSTGIVGEHPHAWELRRLLALIGRTGQHVLVLGESGTGKELAARALHQHSDRACRKLICRNAASIPESLVAAEIFGHAANYPNQGMPERLGLVGQASGSALFLDEIAELSEAQQANLLRVLDEGEYQRLGEARIRHSDLRLIAATNRAPDALKVDFLARFSERVSVPGLNERRSDIPLLLRHLMLGPIGSPRRPGQMLVEYLVRHNYTLHTRELERLMRLCLRSGDSELVAPTAEFIDQLCLPNLSLDLDEKTVRQAVQSHSTLSATAAALGLSNRYALHRLMKKWKIEKPPLTDDGE